MKWPLKGPLLNVHSIFIQHNKELIFQNTTVFVRIQMIIANEKMSNDVVK